MTNPDELERAVERLDVCAGYAAHFGTPRAMQEVVSSRDVYWNDHFAADLRIILAANRKMRAREHASAELAKRAAKLVSQCEAEFTVDGMWSNDGQLVSWHAVSKLKDAIKARSALSTKED